MCSGMVWRTAHANIGQKLLRFYFTPAINLWRHAVNLGAKLQTSLAREKT